MIQLYTEKIRKKPDYVRNEIYKKVKCHEI